MKLNIAIHFPFDLSQTQTTFGGRLSGLKPFGLSFKCVHYHLFNQSITLCRYMTGHVTVFTFPTSDKNSNNVVVCTVTGQEIPSKIYSSHRHLLHSQMSTKYGEPKQSAQCSTHSNWFFFSLAHYKLVARFRPIENVIQRACVFGIELN